MSEADGRHFDEELAAFAGDREAFRDAIADLRSRGETVLERSECLEARSEQLVSDLERLESEVSTLREDVLQRLAEALAGVEQQRAEAEHAVATAGAALEGLRGTVECDVKALADRARTDVATLLGDAEEAHEKVLARAHSDYSSLILRTREEHETILARARSDHEDLVERTRTSFETIRAAVETLERGIADRMAAIERHSAELGERMDATSVGLLQATADLSELLDRFDEIQQLGGSVQAQVDRGTRAVARVAGRTKALAQLRWVVGLVAIGLGAALGGVAVALGTLWGDVRLGWLVGGLEAVPFVAAGVWVMVAVSPAQAQRPKPAAALTREVDEALALALPIAQAGAAAEPTGQEAMAVSPLAASEFETAET